MPEQEPGFEVSEATKQMTKPEIDMLFPPDETEVAVIYNGLQKVFREEAKDVVVKMRTRRQPSQKRPRSR